MEGISQLSTFLILRRIAVLGLMALLVGYTANASATQLGAHTSALAEVINEPSTGEAVATHCTRDPALVTATAFSSVVKFSRVASLI
ncbi:unnamed protein product [Rhizoctonia solani]|uniref:Uncharacterized protein n=1 Tax=Rhizoctonia solani TaxID=456999 RepID=A0A8H3GSP0_9AGAM|nr:unnamed protein product [Rhizoctonia solani]